MLDLLNSVCLRITDPALGWLLHLPRDLALLIIAIATSAILTFVRLFTTNQDMLGRCAADKKRLKELMREAKKAGDKEAVKRYRGTQGVIALKAMAAEGKPLLAAILPVALLAVWCFGRIAYHPPKAGEPIQFSVWFKKSHIGEVASMVPQEGLEAVDGWIRRIGEDYDLQGEVANGVATWTLRPEGRPDPYRLQVRFGGRVIEHDMLVGERVYTAGIQTHQGGPAEISQVLMPETMLFDLVPGLPTGNSAALGLPKHFLAPWILAYLLIAIPFVLLLKRVFRIY